MFRVTWSRAGVASLLCLACATMAPSLDGQEKKKASKSLTYEGYVDGIDVQTMPPDFYACYAFINMELGSDNYIQVKTSDHRLQTALETASTRGVKVEVSYWENNDVKVLTRIRFLDRGPMAKSKKKAD